MATIDSLNASTYRIDLGSFGRVEIGDAASGEFIPHIKAGKWGEVFCGLRFPSIRKVAPILQSSKLLTWQSAADGVRVEFKVLDPDKQHEDGALDFTVVLLSRPARNTFQLPVSSEGLAWCYQPALTAEQIKNGAYRPENVVGSYAVYHAARGPLHASGAEANRYRCGKAFHVYRPLITDAGGKQIFADLKVDGGYMTVTVEQAWLDAALYPVVIDPTFGYSSLGASDQNVGAYEIGCLQLTDTSQAGTLTNLSVGMTPNSATQPQRFGLYSDSSNLPATRLVYDASTWQPGSTSKAFYSNPVAWSYSISAGVQYWAVLGCDSAYASGVVHWDSTGSVDIRRVGDDSGLGLGGFATISGSGLRQENVRPSAYATYTAAAGGIAPHMYHYMHH